MSPFDLEFRTGGLHLPQLGLWLDPHDPISGPERVFISHAHSDHIAPHREVILSAATAKLMQTRLAGQRCEHILSFGEQRRFDHPPIPFDLTLLAAGHIFGSAMALVEADGQSLLYTGDFKLRRGLSAETCEPRRADILIMETTFGRPQYVFPPTEGVLRGIVRFCLEALDNDEIPVLLGYSLGKSQEVLCSLGEAKLPLMLHDTVWKLTRIYEQFGQCFPSYEAYDAHTARGKVILCPPHLANSSTLRNLGRVRTAILTGWSMDPNARYRYQCDAAFPLSDHADFPDLLEMVKRVDPKKVYTLHGFAADFADTLRHLGYDAQALSENEQFTLPLGLLGRKKQSLVPHEDRSRSSVRGSTDSTPLVRNQPSPPPNAQSNIPSFAQFALTCDQIRQDSSKLQKIHLLAEYLRTLSGDNVAFASTWFTGRPFPANQNKVLHLGWAVLRDALCGAGAVDHASFHHVYLQHSDLGETAAHLLAERPAAMGLALDEVDALFDKLHAAKGPLAKTPLLQAALARCSPLEAKYLVKIITGDLRIGLKEGLVEEAIAGGFGRNPDEVRQAGLLLGDLGETARLAAENRLAEAALTPFRPVRFMLASPEPTPAAIWERVKDWTIAAPQPEPAVVGSPGPPDSPVNVWLEDKYDGIRCQLHKVDQQVALYSRDLKDITSTFLEVADAARRFGQDFILDGEIVAMRGEEVLPFAHLQKRLGRRQGDLFMPEEVPIKLVAFDLLWQAGRTLLQGPLRERRRDLEALLANAGSFLRLARTTQAASEPEIDLAFQAARDRGNEGLMIKDPASPYTPGRRGLAWLKLKKAFATLDCVIIGAEYGHGKRSKVLSDYTFAVRDDRTGELKTIGKAYTGLTDAEIAELTQRFLKTAIRQRGRYFEVPPDTVLEVAFDKIQPSDRHASGLALRFPRIVRIRTDKPVTEIDTVATARRLVERKFSSPSA